MIEKIKRLYELGVSKRSIARGIGVNVKTMEYWLIKGYIPRVEDEQRMKAYLDRVEKEIKEIFAG